MMAEIYNDGSYLENNPSWHEEDSPWKANQIQKMIRKNSLKPKTICEIGCGAGEILNRLSAQSDTNTKFFGYEVSSQAFELCNKKSSPKLVFKHADLLEIEGAHFDIIMAIDVIEHVEDCFGFLRSLRPKAEYHIFHIPLDLSVQTVLRGSPIMKNRKSVGHIHYFTQETALETLKDTGYEIVDWFYTCGGVELRNQGWKVALMRMPRKLAFLVNEKLASRLLGGFSLMVLTRQSQPWH